MIHDTIIGLAPAREIVQDEPPSARRLVLERDPEQWISSPELLALVGVAQFAQGVCAWLRSRRLPQTSGAGKPETYTDAMIFMTALVMRIWQLSLGQITAWLRRYPALAQACGYPPGRTISKSHLSRRLRQLGPLPFLFYLIWLVRDLLHQGVIQGRDLIIDSTTVLAWYQADLAAAYSWAHKFGYKVHTIICRSSYLPLWFVVSSANRNDGPFAVPLLRAVVLVYGCAVKVVRADAAYWVQEFLELITALGAQIAVDYNVRRKNRALVPRAWMLWWNTRMGKRSTIERFFAIAKRWFGLNDFQGKGWDAFLLHTLLTYCAILSVALAATRVGRPDLRLSPRRLLAPC